MLQKQLILFCLCLAYNAYTLPSPQPSWNDLLAHSHPSFVPVIMFLAKRAERLSYYGYLIQSKKDAELLELALNNINTLSACIDVEFSTLLSQGQLEHAHETPN